MAQQTAMQALWEWVDANCHEDGFDINDARDMSLKLEKEQIMKAVDRGFDEGCKFPEDMSLSNSEQYYNETYNKQ